MSWCILQYQCILSSEIEEGFFFVVVVCLFVWFCARNLANYSVTPSGSLITTGKPGTDLQTFGRHLQTESKEGQEGWHWVPHR